jgi:N-acetylneuraminate lyase
MPTAALKLRGLVAPVFTPFRADGSLDLDKVERQAEHLAGQGIVGVFVAGTTGEGLSLTILERRQLLERWVAVVGRQLPVIAHVGHDCLADAKTLAAHAAQAGATAIAAIPPFYYKTRTPRVVQDVVSCCVEIAAAAPALPFYYYHIPGNTGVNLNVTEFIVAAEVRLPTLAGLKCSDADLIAFGRTVDYCHGDYDLFFGVDELLLPAWSVGATVAIGSTYNFACTIYRRMIDAAEGGDLPTARQLHEQTRILASSMRHHGGLPAMKAAMRLCGVDCGPCRLPLRSLDEEEVALLAMAVEVVLAVTPPEGSSAP